LTIGIVLGGLTLIWLGWNLTLDALWQPTDRITVRRILFLSGVKPGERLIDLGCGDGRIVVAAAREFGADAIGVEIDPFRVLWARIWILLSGLSGKAWIVRGNMYTLVVSYYHPIWGWKPDAVGESRDGHPIYLYRIGGEDEKTAQ